MSYHEERFTTPDGLSVYGQRWLPEPPAGAVVVLVHGFVEHSGRYAPLAEDLNRQGYAVYAMDLRGHGRSEGPRCFVRRFDQYLEDLDLFLDRVAAAEPDKPLFLLGHSMGGLIVARWAISRPARQADLRGLILSGPALRVGRGLFPLLRHLAWIASLLAPRLPVVRLGGRRISRDPAVVEDFRRDPLVFHDRFPVRMGAEILAAMRSVGRSMEALHWPLLILHGTGDCVCDVEGSRQLHRRAGSTDKTLRLYAGLYHDLVHEPERAEVLADVLTWLDARR